MKTKTLLLAVALLLSTVLYSQSIHVQQMDDLDGYALKTSNAILEADDNSLMISMTFEGGKINRIMKMTDEGEIISSKYIEINEGAHRGFYPFFRHPERENTNVYVYFVHGDSPSYNAVLFDNDLNVIERISTPLPYKNNARDIVYTDNEACILDSENNIVIMREIEDQHSFLCVKLDLEGNIIAEKEIFIDIEGMSWDLNYHPIIVYNEEPLQYAYSLVNNVKVAEPNCYHTEMCVVVMDSEFNVIEIKENIDAGGYSIMGPNQATVSRYDDEFYLSSASVLYNAPVSFDVKLKKIDKNHNVVKKHVYKIPYGQSNPGGVKPGVSYKSVVTTKYGEVYWIYCKPDLSNNGRQDLYVSLFDSDLNLLWERKIKEGINLSHWYIMSATVRDNGSLLISAWGGIEHDVLIVIMDKNEMLDINEQTITIRPYSFYPNPASDMINLSFSPDVKAEKVEIYGIDGKLYHEQNFNLETINIDNLSNGVYMMKVQLTNGNTYTDKIVVR